MLYFQNICQGTAAGGTTEIVVNGTTGLLHPIGKEGITPLAKNIVKLATHVERRLTMGKRGHERVKEMFLEHHMAHWIAAVLKEVLHKSKTSSHSWCFGRPLNYQVEPFVFKINWEINILVVMAKTYPRLPSILWILKGL